MMQIIPNKAEMEDKHSINQADFQLVKAFVLKKERRQSQINLALALSNLKLI